MVAHASLTLTTPAAAARLRGTTVGLASWDHLELTRPDGGSLIVTAVPARHGPVGCEPITGDVTGFVVSGDGVQTVFVSGDNAAVDLVPAITGRVGPIDGALLFAGAARTSVCDGAQLTLTSRDAAEAARVLDARWVVPLHTRGCAHFPEGPQDIRVAFEAAGRLHRVLPGASEIFFKNHSRPVAGQNRRPRSDLIAGGRGSCSGPW